ncbi:MAG TPA: NAD(P)/FAD-dependent oxidoreductase [Candidatus Limnocylindrales bacterium]|nr:NAD(P)/FAD-dependent oxidoreductase [Candidatus Limnocylindrales bacterium]
MRYKVAIIGAGPGGVILARELARQQIDVTVYEKGEFSQLGHNWSDATELIALNEIGLEMPRLEGTEWKGALVKNTAAGEGLFEKHAIPRLKLYSPGMKSVKEIDFRMITTDRRNLGKTLAQQAEDAGAAIRYRHEGLSLVFSENGTKGLDGVEILGVKVRDLDSGQEEVVNADIVVESSGFQSVLRTSLPLYTGLADPFKDHDFALVHREVRARETSLVQSDIIPDHYRYGFHTGYQWSHIHDEKNIDIGAGVRNDPTNPDPKDLIEEFIAKHPSIKPEKLRGGRSLCIVGRPLMSFVSKGFLVIGDAASTSVPTTGCGAGSAMLTGMWAAEVISEAAAERRNDLEKLWEINKKFYITSDRGPSLAALSALRTALQNLSHDDLDFLFDKNLMDAATLQYAVNGVFKAPDLGTMVKALLGGITRPSVLLKLNKAIGGGTQIYNHYKNYPAAWNPTTYQRWKTRTEELFAKTR